MPICPICTNECIEGEYVDIGVGMQKCSPDFCDSCWWYELGFYEEPILTDSQFKKCWELQVAPKWAPHVEPSDSNSDNKT